MNARHLRYKDEQPKEPYHYTACGLDDVYLLCGYEEYDTPHGKGVSVKDVDGLHQAIAMHLAQNKKVLNGKEVRFLRKQLDYTQAELGKYLGVDAQTVARWEKDQIPIPGPADGLLRIVYLADVVLGRLKVQKILRELADKDAPIKERQFFCAKDGKWQRTAA
jgi:putative transcriptional regulator